MTVKEELERQEHKRLNPLAAFSDASKGRPRFEEEREEDVILETAPQMEVQSEEIVNILLIGADYQSGDFARSDSMILCTYNKKTGQMTMTSFLRDLYVPIPGYGSNRINASYTYGGAALLKKTISQNLYSVSCALYSVSCTLK